jgi:hypothetical protein
MNRLKYFIVQVTSSGATPFLAICFSGPEDIHQSLSSQGVLRQRIWVNRRFTKGAD